MSRTIDTEARLAARDQYLENLWLTPEMITALVCWLGMHPTDPKVGAIRRVVGASASTVRKHKDTNRHTAFARKTRLQHRLSPGTAKYTKPIVINAASVLLISKSNYYIALTDLQSPDLNPRRNYDRYRDMGICREFLLQAANKFMRDMAWKDELLTIESFARLGLLPNELLEADAAYNRLTRLVEAVNHKPMLGVATGFNAGCDLEPSIDFGSYRRRRRMTIGDFCKTMAQMDQFSGSVEDIAEVSRRSWTYEDQKLLSDLAKQLRARLI